jgi:hypothetical protein
MVVVLLAFAVGFSLGWGWKKEERRALAQASSPTPSNVVVDQHWRIVPTTPIDLQNQLEILNKAGIEVSQSQIVIVGDKLVIMVSDPADDESNK